MMVVDSNGTKIVPCCCVLGGYVKDYDDEDQYQVDIIEYQADLAEDEHCRICDDEGRVPKCKLPQGGSDAKSEEDRTCLVCQEDESTEGLGHIIPVCEDMDGQSVCGHYAHEKCLSDYVAGRFSELRCLGLDPQRKNYPCKEYISTEKRLQLLKDYLNPLNGEYTPYNKYKRYLLKQDTAETSHERQESLEAVLKQLQSAGNECKVCPRCLFLVEKDSGCDHMTCQCGYEYCQICGENHWEDAVGVATFLSLDDCSEDSRWAQDLVEEALEQTEQVA